MRPGGEPAVFVTRGQVVESVHRAFVAVATPEGRLVARLGKVGEATYLRSSAKPFQALPLVETGAADAFHLTPEELAVIAGSHGGEDRHVKAVEGILAKGGLAPGDLQCGVHRPYHGPTAARVGDQATALHHNCSGKHAGLLLLAKHLGVPTERYIDPATEGQRRIRRTLAEVAGLPLSEVRVGTDGCSAPNFAIPVRSIAIAFARLGAPERSPGHGDALRRVRDAMRAHPGMVAGEGRGDTALMETAPDLVSKSGAEGVHGAASERRGLGVAVKVEDGASRASFPVLAEALRQQRLLTSGQRAALEPLLGRVQKNWAGRSVGSLEARFRLRG